MKEPLKKDVLKSHQTRVLHRLAKSKETNTRGLERLFLCYSNSNFEIEKGNELLLEIAKQLNRSNI